MVSGESRDRSLASERAIIKGLMRFQGIRIGTSLTWEPGRQDRSPSGYILDGALRLFATVPPAVYAGVHGFIRTRRFPLSLVVQRRRFAS